MIVLAQVIVLPLLCRKEEEISITIGYELNGINLQQGWEVRNFPNMEIGSLRSNQP